MDFSNISDKKILVIGDVMIDRNVFGKVTKISPEAPVQVVNKTYTQELLGGASNVANNIASLGSQVTLITVTGDDNDSDIFKNILESKHINGHIIYDSTRPTTVKERIFAMNQQLLRIDNESSEPLKEDVKKRLRETIISDADRYDVIVLSDYAKGVIYEGMIDDIRSVTKAPILVDPKPKNMKCYHKATMIKPNKVEMEAMSGISINSKEALQYAAAEMLKKYNCEYILVTLSGDGMALFQRKGDGYFIDTDAKAIVDVCGAGDTVISTFAVSLANGNNIIDSCDIANKAAGIVVSKLGTSTVTKEELFS